MTWPAKNCIICTKGEYLSKCAATRATVLHLDCSIPENAEAARVKLQLYSRETEARYAATLSYIVLQGKLRHRQQCSSSV
jgi:hypothetical protein